MAKKRRKKAAKKSAKKTAKRMVVNKSIYDKLVHLGATHHKTLKQLRASARVAPARKKARKKASRRR